MANCFFLSYDLPTKSKLPNPTRYLRPIAFRINKSDWIIMESSINEISAWMMRCRAKGAIIRLLKFDATVTPTIVQSCVQYIADSLKAELDSCRADFDSAVASLREGSGENGQKSPEEIEEYKAYRAKCRKIIRKNRRLIRDMKSTGERFGIDIGMTYIGTAVAAVEAMDAKWHARDEMLGGLVRKVRAARGKDDAMAKSVEKGKAPVDIFFDYAEDSGADTTKARLAFEF